jgi:hypothetical protein
VDTHWQRQEGGRQAGSVSLNEEDLRKTTAGTSHRRDVASKNNFAFSARLYMCACICVFVCWFTMYSLHEIDLEFVSECERLRVSDQPRLSSTTFMCVSAVWIVSIYFFSQSEAPEGRKEYF